MHLRCKQCCKIYSIMQMYPIVKSEKPTIGPMSFILFNYLGYRKCQARSEIPSKLAISNFLDPSSLGTAVVLVSSCMRDG